MVTSSRPVRGQRSPLSRAPFRAALVGAVALLTAACGGGDKDRPEVLEGHGVKLAESDIRAELAGGNLDVKLVLQRLAGTPISGRVHLELLALGHDAPLSGDGVDFSLDGPSHEVALRLPAPPITSPGELGGYALRYTVQLPGGELYGKRSLFMAVRTSGLAVIGNDRFPVGEQGVLRVLVTDPRSGAGVAGAAVALTFKSAALGATRPLASGATNARGELEASFTFADAELGPGKITVQAAGHTSTHDIAVERERQILLTTDKPLYQPGQTVHIRALAMKQPRVQPVAGEKLLLEVEDAQGNKLFKEETTTDAYGIAALRFELARIVILGTYKARVTMGSTVREKTFTVDRYTLPKFKVVVTAAKALVKPGETISGAVQANYFFDKQVAGGDVKLTATAAPSGKLLGEVLGKTDDTGRLAFSVVASGNAQAVALEAVVTDAAGATARGRASVLVSAAAAVVQLVPERHTVAGNDELRLFVVLTDPAGAPRAGLVTVSGFSNATVNVPASGIAALTVKAACQAVHELTLIALHEGASASVTVSCDSAGGLRLATDRALYKEGESAAVSVRAPPEVTSVTLEVVRHNATVLSQVVPLTAGQGSATIALTGDRKRTLELKGWATRGVETLTDRKLIYVRGADELRLQVTSDKTSYRPAEQAKITLAVTDASGKPAPGALGVQVVDEALYALTDLKPGIERRAFFLEQEVIAAGDKLRFVSPEVTLADAPTADDQLRAAALFASAENKATYPINFRSSDKEQPLAVQRSRAGLTALLAAMERRFHEDNTDGLFGPPSLTSRQAWASDWLGGHIDDFGVPYRITTTGETAQVQSAGMDELWGTADDLTGSISLYVPTHSDRVNLPSAPIYDGGYWSRDASSRSDAGLPPPVHEGGVMPGKDGGAATEAPKIREYFPETLYVNPALITDSEGKATIDLTLADSITSWRLSALAHTTAGQLGSTASGITVFQEFFVDVLLPTSLLQNDEVAVPVAIYNYLATPQTVTVQVKSAAWFTLVGADTQQVTLPAKSVAAVSFRLRAKQVGTFVLTATGTSATDADGVSRTVNVLPDGVRQEVSKSGALKPGTVSHTIAIPASAIAGATELQVRVFPGLLAEAVQGLESIFHAPYGCFEQTSSATYPNVMVLQYLKAAGLSTPALEKKALGYIDDGYQRLLKYEVPGGGFSLWGAAPASLVLTAFGLLEFSDMAKVRFVDPALLSRTQGWLIKQQQASGAFQPPGQSWYEIPTNIGQDTVRATAYVAWALARSGYTGPTLKSALAYVKAQVASQQDAYTLAVAANALLEADPTDATALTVLAKLKSLASVAGAASWSSSGASMSYGYGQSMQVETTSLVVAALLLAKDSSELTAKGLAWLAQSKSSFGGYGTTQATILAIRTLLLALAARGGDTASGTIDVSHNGVTQGTATVTPATSDVTRLFDLKQAAVTGDNTVTVAFAGSGELAYQVTAVYYLPHSASPPLVGPLGFSVSYDKTVLKINDRVTVTAAVKNLSKGDVPTVMMRIGLPPGFTVDLDELSFVKTNGVVNFAEQQGPYLVLYLGTLSTQLGVTFPMTATLAVVAKAPPSTAYPYYTPEYARVVESPLVTVTP